MADYKYDVPAKYYKAKSPFIKKSQALAIGINNSSKSQLKKIQKADTSKNIPQVPLGDLYYRSQKHWVHKGKFCYLCDQPLSHDPIIIDKHRYVCENINKSNRGNDDAST